MIDVINKIDLSRSSQENYQTMYKAYHNDLIKKGVDPKSASLAAKELAGQTLKTAQDVGAQCADFIAPGIASKLSKYLSAYKAAKIKGPSSPRPDLKYPLSELPVGGDRPYIPQKQKGIDPTKDVTKYKGDPVDNDKNIWQWEKGTSPHAGPHWNVQHKDGSHTNVDPAGTVIGRDNFPNKPGVPVS